MTCRHRIAGPLLAAVMLLSASTLQIWGPANAALLLNGNASVDPSGETAGDAPLPKALQQLEQQKRLDRDVAERALQSVPDYVQARKLRTPPAPLADNLEICLRTLAPLCLLREALAHAYAVEDESRRDWALTDVAGALAALGEPNLAMGAVALIDDPRRALRSLVAAGLTVSPASPKKALVSGLLPENTEARAGLRSAESGDWEAAFEQVSAIEQPRFRSVAWSRVARVAAKQDQRERAQQALALAEADIPAIQVLYGRGFAQYEAALTRHAILTLAGNDATAKAQRAAVSAADAIDLPHLRADMFMRLSSILDPRLSAQALRLADAALLKTKSKLRRIFVLTGPTRSPDSVRRAAAIADTIKDPLDRSRAFVRLAALRDSP